VRSPIVELHVRIVRAAAECEQDFAGPGHDAHRAANSLPGVRGELDSLRRATVGGHARKRRIAVAIDDGAVVSPNPKAEPVRAMRCRRGNRDGRSFTADVHLLQFTHRREVGHPIAVR
jgi:hypothetical protein